MLMFTINKETSIYAGMGERERDGGRQKQREIMDEQRPERDKRTHEKGGKTDRDGEKGMTGKR